MARAEAEATKAELAALKGKKLGREVEHSQVVVPAVTMAGRTRGLSTTPKSPERTTRFGRCRCAWHCNQPEFGWRFTPRRWNLRWNVMLLAIYQGIPEDMLASLHGKDTAKAVWEAIKSIHVGHDRVRETNLQTLCKAFEAPEMGDTEPVDTFATRLNKMVSLICALGDEVKEFTVVQKILQAAPARLMQIESALE